MGSAKVRNEKDLKPFWSQESDEITEKLWLPTETDSIDLISTCPKGPPTDTLTERSWFSIKQKLRQKDESLPTPLQLSQYSLRGERVVPSNEKIPVRTLKIRIFPNETEKTKLKTMFHQQRWYYNAMVNLYFSNEIKKKNTRYNASELRELLLKYSYSQERSGNVVFHDYTFDENGKEFPIPHWWSRKDIHTRLPRGAVCKFTYSLNSANSNLKNGNIKGFQMKFQTKKSVTNYLHFEDI